MRDLFIEPGIAHSILVFAVVIATGLYLGKFKFKGISIGSTWILFVGILISHFGVRVDATVLNFMKDFGLILFVFSIGLQVGPGFFHSFKKGGLTLNMLALCLVFLGVGVTFVLHLVTKEDLPTMVGVMSGAVTNTPGLGAAQQTLADSMHGSQHPAADIATATSGLASAYALAYPIGMLGVIAMIILFKSIFKIDLEEERRHLEQEDTDVETARRMHCEVENPALFGKKLKEVMRHLSFSFVISRVMRDGEIFVPGPDTVLQQGDKLLIVTSQHHVDSLRILFGKEIEMHLQDWLKQDAHLEGRRLLITKPELTGARLRQLNIRANYGVTITRVVRAGVELVARPNLYLQLGDILWVVGPEEGIHEVAELVGNKEVSLNKPNLVPIFFGIAAGVIFGSIPFMIPGIPQPIKLGLAGGPLIIAILLGYFGPRWRITTYTTQSANLMIREIGISFFMAAVGLGAGENFCQFHPEWRLLVDLIRGAHHTGSCPIVGMIARWACRLNFYQISGLSRRNHQRCGAGLLPGGLRNGLSGPSTM